MSAVQAQPSTQPAPKAKAPAKNTPKAAPAQKGAPTAQAPAQPPAATQPAEQVQLIYAPWTKFCLKGQDANAKQVCFTGKDGRIESGQPVIAAVIIEPEGEAKKILRVTLPLGMTRVTLRPSQNPVRSSGSSSRSSLSIWCSRWTPSSPRSAWRKILK